MIRGYVMVKKINFKSAASYKKWIAYGHSAGLFKSDKPGARVSGNLLVTVRGKKRKITHVLPISKAKSRR